MKVYLTFPVRSLEVVVDLAIPCLLPDFDGQAIRGNILDVDPQRFTNSQSRSRAKNEQHPIVASGDPNNPSNYVTHEGRLFLFFLVHYRHVNKIGVPLPWIQLLALFIDRRCDNRLHNLCVVPDGFG